ncbi:uncharacterized protein LOC114531256 [Dendronephthya gigantea]|uniref:uncharacterized protein LOC114516814 n=1 Tax=Dendronephthya gigantea TaxID=151771 RepID=UPI00106B99AB|nr:uncharacterized protein LOC114516814 [Dendronephthya gigantea]XP_028408699.1 uncharacterized protein LOC114531256 [Dendronephthya gigantea]
MQKLQDIKNSCYFINVKQNKNGQGARSLCDSRLAHSGLVSYGYANARARTCTSKGNGQIVDLTQPPHGTTSTTSKAKPTGSSIIRERIKRHGLTSSTTDIVMASWRTGTAKQYSIYLTKWKTYCDNEGVDMFCPGVMHAVEFLGSLYASGLSYSAINTARSALSTILPMENGVTFGDHPLVSRTMKGIFELRPALPRYSEIWDVNVVLNYLKNQGIPAALSLKQLTLKLTMLLCLLTGQRCQTVHSMDIKYMQKMTDRYRITIQQKLKQTKSGKHIDPIELMAFDEDPGLCVVQHLDEYIERTAKLRDKHTQLLISYVKPHRSISKDTVARWVREVLKSSGINTDVYGAHSSRAASTSFCHRKGLDMVTIMKSAGWSNSGTFARFYGKPLEQSNFGQTVVENLSL